MKKAILSAIAGVMAIGFTFPTIGLAHTEHGDADGAVVSDEQGAVEDNATEFYLNVDKDATNPDGGKDSIKVPAAGNETDTYTDSADNRISYDIFFAVTGSYQLDVTIPLYVCMYANGADGSVITPSPDAYAIHNASSSNDSAKVEIAEVVKKTTYTQLLANEDAPGNNGIITGVSYDEDTQEYQFFYETPENTADIPNYQDISALGYNTSGSWNVFFSKTTGYDFKRSTDLTDGVLRTSVFPTVDDKLFLTVNLDYSTDVVFPKEDGIYMGASQDSGSKEALGVKVTEIATKKTSWSIKSAATKGSDLQPGDFVMTLTPQKAANKTAIDLSEVTTGKDITANGWEIAGNEKLGISIFTKIAGGSVNETAHVPVMRVSYKVVPSFDQLGEEQ